MRRAHPPGVDLNPAREERLAFDAQTLDQKNLLGREGRAYTWEQNIANGWYGREGRTYAEGELVTAGLFGRTAEGKAYKIKEVPAHYIPLGRRLYTRVELRGHGYAVYRRQPISVDGFIRRTALFGAADGDGVEAIVAHPGGDRVFTGRASGELQEWSVLGRRKIGVPLVPGGIAGDPKVVVGDLSVAHLAYSDAAGTIVARHIATGARMQIETTRRLHALDWYSGPGGDLIAMSMSRGTVGVRAWADGAPSGPFQRVHVAPQDTQALAFRPDGKLLAMGDTRGEVRFFSTVDWKEVGSVNANRSRVAAMAWVAEGAVLAVATAEGDVHFFEVGDLAMDGEVRNVQRAIGIFNGEARSLGVGDDGWLLVVPGRGAEFHVWDVESGEVVQTISTGQRTILSVDVAGQVDRIVLGHSNGLVTAWQARLR